MLSYEEWKRQQSRAPAQTQSNANTTTGESAGILSYGEWKARQAPVQPRRTQTVRPTQTQNRVSVNGEQNTDPLKQAARNTWGWNGLSDTLGINKPTTQSWQDDINKYESGVAADWSMDQYNKPAIATTAADLDKVSRINYVLGDEYDRLNYDIERSDTRFRNLDYLSDDEKAVVAYYAQMGDIDSANKYLDAKSRDINERAMAAYRRSLEEHSDWFANSDNALVREVGGDIYDMGVTLGGFYGSTMGALANVEQNIENRFTGKNDTVDPNSMYFRGTAANEIGQKNLYEDKKGVRKLATEIVQQSLQQYVPAILMGGGAVNYIFGLASAGQTAYQNAQEGGNPLEGLIDSTVKGLVSYESESRLSADELFGLGGREKFTLTKEGLKLLARNMAGEAYEELEEAALDTIWENLFLGRRSEYAQRVNGYMNAGMTEGDAEQQAAIDFAKETGYSMMVAALSAGVDTMGSAGADYARVNVGLMNAANRRAVIEEGQGFADKTSKAYTNAESLRQKEDVSRQEAYQQYKLNQAQTDTEYESNIRRVIRESGDGSRVASDREVELIQKALSGEDLSKREVRAMSDPVLRKTFEYFSGEDIRNLTEDENVRYKLNNYGTQASHRGVGARYYNTVDRIRNGNLEALSRLSDEARSSASKLQANGQKALAAMLERNNYKSRKEMEQAVKEFARRYEFGTQWNDKADIKNSVLTERDKYRAYYAGQNDSNENLYSYAQKNSDNRRSANAGLDMGSVRGATAVNKIRIDNTAKQLGVRVRFDSAENDANLAGSDGYETSDGTIVLNSNLGTDEAIRAIYRHEAVHRMRILAPAEYKNLARAVSIRLTENGKLAEQIGFNTQRYAEDVQKGMINATTDVFEEIVADFIGDVQHGSIKTGSTITMEQFADMMSAANKNTIQRFIDKLKKGFGKAEMVQSGMNRVVDALQSVMDRSVAEAQSSREAISNDNTVRNAVKYDKAGKPYVEIDTDILTGVPRNKWISTVKSYLQSHKIAMDGFEVVVNAITRNEYLNSREAQSYRNSGDIRYADKLRMANNIDEIVQNVYGTRNENSKHGKFLSNNRGFIDAEIAGRAYSIEVITGINSQNSEILYDLVNIQPTTIRKSVANKNTAYASRDARVSQRSLLGDEAVNSVSNIQQILDKVNSADSSGQKLTIDEQSIVIEAAQADIKDIRMSKSLTGKSVVEKTPRLLAVHNIPGYKLIKAMKLGGFAMPSLAVVLAEEGHWQYGEYSFIFPSWMIDPSKSRYNKIWGGDAWTQQINSMVEYKLDSEKVKRLTNRLMKLSDKVAEGAFSHDISNFTSEYFYSSYRASEDINEIADRAIEKPAFMARYLGEKGESVEKQYRVDKQDLRGYDPRTLQELVDKYGEEFFQGFGSRFANLPEGTLDTLASEWERLHESDPAKVARMKGKTRLQVLAAQGLGEAVFNYLYHEDKTTYDPYLTRDAMYKRIQDSSSYEDYKQWVRDQFTEDLVEKAGIYNGKDIFTPSGNRRSFEALHDDLTLMNLVRAMRKQQDSKGQGLYGNPSPGELIARTAKRYNNLNEVRADEKRLGRLGDKEYGGQVVDRIKFLMDNVGALAEEDIDNGAYKGYDFDEALIKTAMIGQFDQARIKRSFKRYGCEISDELATDLKVLYDFCRNVPTGYFEAKIENAVTFQDMLDAGVRVLAPEDGKQNQQLKDLGFTIETYTDEADRKAKFNSEYTEGMRFSKVNSPTDSFESQFQRYKDGKFSDNDYFNLGDTPYQLVALGAKPLPLYMSQSTVAKMQRDETINKSGHSLTDDDVLDLPRMLNNPIMVIKSDAASVYGKPYTSYVVVTDRFDKNNDRIIISIRLNANLGYGVVTNRVTSAYGRKNFRNWLNDQIYYGNIIGWDKKAAKNIITSTRLQLPTEDNILDFNTIVSQSKNAVNSQGEKLTDAQSSYFKDSKVRDENGNLLVVYHGTNEDFTVFKANPYVAEQNGLTRIKGYFSAKEDYAENYGRTKAYYLNIKNPLEIVENDMTLDEWKRFFESKGVKGIRFDSDIVSDTTRGRKDDNGRRTFFAYELIDGVAGYYWRGDGNVTEAVEKAGYDGMHWDNDEDAWMPFGENQIKSVDNKNPTDNPDIRYSRFAPFTTPSGETVTGYGAESRISEGSVENYARDLVRNYGTSLTIKSVKEDILDLYERMRTNADGLDVWGEANTIAANILDNMFEDTTEAKKAYADVKANVKGSTIATGSLTVDDIPSQFDSVGEFIRKTRDVFSFAKDGLPVDVALQEMYSRDAGLDNQGIGETPLGYILEKVRGIRADAEKNIPVIYGAERTAELNALTNEIIDNYFETPEAKKTGLDLMISKMQQREIRLKDELENAKKEIADLKKGHKKQKGNIDKLLNQQERLQKRIDRLNGQIASLGDSIKELKAARSKDVKKVRQDNRNINKILDVATTFKQWGKGERNASEFADPVIKGFVNELGKIKYRSDISRTKARKLVASLQKWYTEENLGDYFNQTIKDRIDYIAERKDNTKYPDSEELQYIADVMQGIKHLYRTYDQMTLDGQKVSIRDTARAEWDVLEASHYSEARIRRLNRISNDIGYGLNKGINNALNNIIEPRVVYRTIEGFNEDGLLQKLFKATTDAETRMNAQYIEMTRDFDSFFSEHKGYGKHYARDTISIAGKELTIGEAISLYWTANREEAKATLQSNNVGSGIVWQRNGVTQRIRNVEDVEALRSAIWDQLTAEDKELAQMVHEFFTVTATDIKQEADYRILGFTNIQEGRDDYYRFIRNKDQIGRKYADAKSLMSDVTSAYNYSFNKDIKQNVTLALQLIPADQMWKDHARKMSMYSSMTEILQTWDKVLNANLAVDENGKKIGQENLRSKIQEKWRDFSTYHSHFMQDVQNKGRGESNPIANFVRGAYATAQLGFNRKVILSQFASYPTALMFLDAESMAQGVGMKTDYDLMDKYSPYAMARAYDNGIVLSEGNITSTIGEIGDKTTKPISQMDRFTIGKIWNACQAYVAKHQGYRIGTEENLKAAAELHEQICRETQPNYTQTERSGMMRSGNEIVKSFTMFTSVPLKQLSRMVESTTKLRMAIEENKRNPTAENKRKVSAALSEVAKVQAACLIANAMYVVMAMLVKAALPKKKEDEEITVGKFAKSMADVYAGLVPVFKDVYGYYTNGYEVNNYFYSSINDLLKTFGKLSDIGDDPFGTMSEVTQQMAMFAGLPVRNAKNTFVGVANRLASLTGSSLVSYEIAKKQKSIANTSNRSYFTEYIYEALYEGNKDDARKIIDDMTSRGHTSEQISNSLKTIFSNRLYEAWKKGDEKEVNKILKRMGLLGWTEDTVASKLKSLMKKDLAKESDIKSLAKRIKEYKRTGKGNIDKLRSDLNKVLAKYQKEGYQQAVIEEAITAAT